MGLLNFVGWVSEPGYCNSALALDPRVTNRAWRATRGPAFMPYRNNSAALTRPTELGRVA
jgi:hypothetical protein